MPCESNARLHSGGEKDQVTDEGTGPQASYGPFGKGRRSISRELLVDEVVYPRVIFNVLTDASTHKHSTKSMISILVSWIDGKIN